MHSSCDNLDQATLDDFPQRFFDTSYFYDFSSAGEEAQWRGVGWGGVGCVGWGGFGWGGWCAGPGGLRIERLLNCFSNFRN